MFPDGTEADPWRAPLISLHSLVSEEDPIMQPQERCMYSTFQAQVSTHTKKWKRPGYLCVGGWPSKSGASQGLHFGVFKEHINERLMAGETPVTKCWGKNQFLLSDFWIMNLS
jgi:hypothetical protein